MILVLTIIMHYGSFRWRKYYSVPVPCPLKRAETTFCCRPSSSGKFKLNDAVATYRESEGVAQATILCTSRPT